MRDQSHPAHFARSWTNCAWLFRSLTENLEQCVFVLDRAGCCLAANDRFCRWLKRPYAEIRGRSLADFWPYPLSEQEIAAHERILHGEWIETEEEGQRGRHPSFVRIRKAPLRDAEGNVCGILCLFREVPVEPHGEPAGAPTAKMEAPGCVMKDILPDLDKLLTLLGNSLSMLRARVSPGLAEAEMMTLRNALTQAMALIDHLLHLASGGCGEMRPVEVKTDSVARPSAKLVEKTILVVEPDRSIARLTMILLSQWGCRVFCSEEGSRAAEIYRANQGAIDLVLVEENLPGESGLELMNELLEINPHLPLVLVSTAGTPAPSWGAFPSSLSFLSKPYTPEQLFQCVWTALSPAANAAGCAY